MDQVVSLRPHALRWLTESELACFATRYLDYLAERRYTRGTAHAYLCCVAHFARWLTRSRLSLDRIDERAVRRFLDEHLPRCACPVPAHRRRYELRAALRHLLQVLAKHGVLDPVEQLTPIEEELRRFDEHMCVVRGLASNTREQRVRIVRDLLSDLFADRPFLISDIKPDAVRGFVMQRLQRWSAASGHVLAIAQYLRFERPATTNRAVFVRHVAPRDVPIKAGVVRRAVRDAFRRSGISQTRVHVLRHTLATRLLNRGSTLKEIADVLRHRALDTSLIYTKLDRQRLAAVALPWPGSSS
jgi:site-specific recombinase XerD